ncbi:MAG: hypothetical protein M9894_02840 [Planctomycetes bacterium]|nr:hypothetical protein [Planctomycetota bacterium]
MLDPAAADAARARVEFTRRFGVPALPAAAGALRAVVALRPGAQARGTAHALVLNDPEQARVTPQGLETRAAMFVRTRFAFRAWHGVRVEGASWGQEKNMVYLGAPHDGGRGGGLLLHVFPPAGDAFISIDRVHLAEWRHGDRGGREAIEGAWTRSFAATWLDGRLLGRVHVPARDRASAGTGFTEHGWGGGRLSALVYEGVWDPRAGEPAPLDPARRRALEAALEPLDPRARVVSENRQAQEPHDLAGLRAQQLVLFARNRWLMWDRWAECAWVPEVSGDFEVRVQVTFPASGGCQAGIALRPSRDQGDALWFGPGGAADNYVVQVSSQRDMTWEKPLRRRPWTPERPVLLVLQRVGDWVTLRFGPDPARLEDLGEPLYFPFDGPVDVGLSARNYNQQQPYLAARFDGFDVRVRR